MYALTKPAALNLGRQNGIQDEAAGELKIDGEWIVFIMICRSISQLQLVAAKIEWRGYTCWMYRMLLRPDQGDDAVIGDKDNI
jgi:hypothetical protein